MNTAKAAQEAGVKVSTLRFYERRGLVRVTTRTDAGYRDYSVDDIRRLRFIRRAQELGFSLAEIEQFLTVSENRKIHQSDVIQIADAKIRDIDERVHDLIQMKKAIRSLMGRGIKADKECPIISSLSGEKIAPAKRSGTKRQSFSAPETVSDTQVPTKK